MLLAWAMFIFVIFSSFSNTTPLESFIAPCALSYAELCPTRIGNLACLFRSWTLYFTSQGRFAAEVLDILHFRSGSRHYNGGNTAGVGRGLAYKN